MNIFLWKYMGCFSSIQKNITNDNMRLTEIYECIRSKNMDDLKTIFKSIIAPIKFHENMSIYHYATMKSLFYDTAKMEELCGILRQNKDFLPNIKAVSLGSKYLQIIKNIDNTWNINYPESDTEWDHVYGRSKKISGDIYNFKNLTPLSLAFELKIKFVPKHSPTFDNCGINKIIELLMELESAGLIPNNKNNDKQCCVCYDKTKNMLFEECGHLAVCEECSGKLKVCPLCQHEVINKKRVYI